MIVNDEINKCSICGNNADSMWHGENEILLCFDCLINFIPALLADARIKHKKSVELYDAIDRFNHNYWRYSALGLSRIKD